MISAEDRDARLATLAPSAEGYGFIVQRFRISLSKREDSGSNPFEPAIIMKKIPLTQGYSAIVDDDDFAVVNQFKWCFANGYAKRKSNKSIILLHRFLLGLLPGDGIKVDHKNSDGLDNRRVNIRPCSESQNQMNRIVSTRSKSGLKGVMWKRDKKKWYAQIRVNGKYHFLGYFDDKRLAGDSYNKAALKYFGEFARLNYI